MAVGDLLGEDGIVGDLVPVDLGEANTGCQRVSTRSVGVKKGALPRATAARLTSFRHFCCRMANRNLVMALSFAFEAMLGVGRPLWRSGLLAVRTEQPDYKAQREAESVWRWAVRKEGRSVGSHSPTPPTHATSSGSDMWGE